MQQATPARESPQRLGLWDTVSVIVGIVIGAGIYETPPLVLGNVSGPGAALVLWALGGFLSLMGAFTYAELASTYPRSGGDYVYLSRAYGPCVGFLFGWAQLAVIMTGSIGMMAYIFASYADKLCDLGPASTVIYAAAAVMVLTVLNILGVGFGKIVQNTLSVVKILGLAGIVAAGFLWPQVINGEAALSSGATSGRVHSGRSGERSQLDKPNVAPADETALSLPLPLGEGRGEGPPAAATTADSALSTASLAVALVFVLLTYGGWNDAAFFVAEMRDRRRIWQALLLGTSLVTVVYLLVNAAYLRALGFEGVRQSHAVAADTLARPLGAWGAKAMCLLVMISALGAVNGLIFAGSRVYASLGADYAIFNWLARRHPRLNSPVWSLTAQAVIALAMILVLGIPQGQQALDAAFAWAGLQGVSWQGRDGFQTLLRSTAPIFWLFFLLTSLSLFALRYKDRATPRTFTVPLYPLTPLVFSATCAYMVVSAINYAGALGLVGAGLLAAGLPIYWISRPTPSAGEAEMADKSV